jgi:hypothetical protein
MALSVIGAGFGRTGTFTLRTALDMLGFGPTHHMVDVNRSDAQKALFRAAGRGEPVDWEAAYDGYRSAVDWPTAYFWRELAAYYPAAKLILTVRDPDAWYKSFIETIGNSELPGMANPESFGIAVIHNKLFSGDTSPMHAKAVLSAHNAEVIAAIPKGRLLVYDVKEGWEPLCRFLDRTVPAEPYPRTNSTLEFQAQFRGRK